jgi:hypothetical protein
VAGLVAGFVGETSTWAQDVYVYKNAQGRPVYVSDPATIPPKFRASAKKVDLSKVDLNEQAGKEWSDRTKEAAAELEKKQAEERAAEERARGASEGGGGGLGGFMDPAELAKAQSQALSNMVEAVKAPAADAGPGAPLWKAYPVLAVLGAFLAVLALMTPFVLRHVSVEKWVRLLTLVVPLLLVLGGMAQFAMQTGRLAAFVKAVPSVSAVPSSKPASR